MCIRDRFQVALYIHDNVLISHEIMHKFKNLKSKTSYVAIKLDMEKAYGRMKWNFILTCFQEMGFHPIWNNWIKECISSVSYSVIINDEPNGLVNPTTGIRQGNPLSPYIFIFCMEVPSLWLSKEASSRKSGIGLKIYPRSITIPDLLFADDCLIFCKTNKQQLCDPENVVRQILLYFRTTS